MTRFELLRELEQISDSPSGSLADATKLKALKQWDSLAVVSFIAIADEKLGLTLDAGAVAKAVTVSDLVQLVDNHLSAG